MKPYIAIAVIAGTVLAGCSTAPPQRQPDIANTTQGISTIRVDCRYATQMNNELEYVIANPTKPNDAWDYTLGWVSGVSTPQQRYNSAKTVLWTVRTQCRGY